MTSFKRSLKVGLQVSLEVAAGLASLVGAPLALLLGKLLLAAILAAVALGIVLRFSKRKVEAVQAPQPIPGWIAATSAIASLVEVTALVEATNLPVRFDQSGFSPWNWVLVLVALAVACRFQIRLLQRLVRRAAGGKALAARAAADR